MKVLKEVDAIKANLAVTTYLNSPELERLADITSKEAEIKSLKALRKYRMYWLCGAILGVGGLLLSYSASQKKIRLGAQCNILN
jgi:hypothetical protein